jgi:hypothetical protein
VQILLGTGVDSDFLTSQLPNQKKDGANHQNFTEIELKHWFEHISVNS